MTVKIEEWRIRKRDTEEWMKHRQLPEDLQERVRRFDQYKWLATRGVKEEDILQDLPLDLRHQIQRHLCLNLVRRVCLSGTTYIIVLLGSLIIYWTMMTYYVCGILFFLTLDGLELCHAETLSLVPRKSFPKLVKLILMVHTDFRKS